MIVDPLQTSAHYLQTTPGQAACPLSPEKTLSSVQETHSDTPSTPSDEAHITPAGNRKKKAKKPEPLSHVSTQKPSDAKSRTQSSSIPLNFSMEETDRVNALAGDKEQEAPSPAATLPLSSSEIFSMIGLVRKGQLQEKERSEMLKKLSLTAWSDNDPLIRGILQTLLTDEVNTGDQLQDCILKEGALRGSANHLTVMGWKVETINNQPLTEEINTIPTVLSAINSAIPEKKAPEDALMALAHTGHRLFARASARLSPEIRVKEPPETSLRSAGMCVDMLERWWEEGRISVEKNGRQVEPGSLSLRERIEQEPVVVNGSTIVLTEVRRNTASHEAREIAAAILDKIKYRDYDDPGIAAMESLCEKDKTAAREVAKAMADMISPLRDPKGEALARFRYFFNAYHGIDHVPSMKKAFRPVVKQLCGIAREADSRGLLSGTIIRGKTDIGFRDYLIQVLGFLRELESSFPEIAGKTVIEDYIAPSVKYDGCNDNVIECLWKKNPGAVDATLELIAGSGHMDMDNHWELLNDAVNERGWIPKGKALRNLASYLWNPSGYLEGFNYRALELFGALKKIKPDILKGITLPDSGGAPASPEKVCFEKFMDCMDIKEHNGASKGSGLVSSSVESELQWEERMGSFFFTRPEAVRSLLDIVDRELSGGNTFQDMSGKGQMAYLYLWMFCTRESQKANREALSGDLAERIALYSEIFSSLSGIDRTVDSAYTTYEHTFTIAGEIAQSSKSPWGSRQLNNELSETLDFYRDIPLRSRSSYFNDIGDFYRYRSEQIASGHTWDEVKAHIKSNVILDRNPREVPVKNRSEANKVPTVDEFDDMLIIDNFRLETRQ